MGVLSTTQHHPAGYQFPPEAFVFGDKVGYKVTSSKKAWETAVLKTHGHTPTWDKGHNSLAPASQVAYGEINLRFRDLRHEAGSAGSKRGCRSTM